MPLLTVVQVLAVLLIFVSLIALKTGQCEHPCEKCAAKRALEDEQRKRDGGL